MKNICSQTPDKFLNFCIEMWGDSGTFCVLDRKLCSFATEDSHSIMIVNIVDGT